jgi:integrase
MNTQSNTTYNNVTYLYNTDNVVPFTLPQQYIRPVPTAKPSLDDILDDFDRDINQRHDAEPFKNKQDIDRILTHFLTQHMTSWNRSIKQPSKKWNPRYLRNYLLFQIGLSCGLRSSDLTRLQLGYFINKDGSYRQTTEIAENKITTKAHTKSTCTTYIDKTVVDADGNIKKTSKVIKPTEVNRKHRDTRTIYINQDIIDALELHKQFHPNWTRQDYLFPNGYDTDGKPTTEYITRQNFDLIIKGVTKELGITGRYASHTPRKTFAYHALQKLGNNDRGIKVLQKILGHTDLDSTYHYVGITQDEIKDTCMRLHLGFTAEELTQRGLI